MLCVAGHTGASGYPCKDHAASELVYAFHRLAQGRMYITEDVAEKLALSSMHTAPVRQHTLNDMPVFYV